jgi:multiple sugar transport system permease protein
LIKIANRKIIEPLTGFLLVAPAVLYFGIVYYFPLLQSFINSFYSESFGSVGKFVGLGMYQKVLADQFFWLSVKNTVYFAFLSVPATIILALLFAIMLDRVKKRKLRSILGTVFILPQVTSLVAAALIWEWIFNPVYGVLNFALSYFGIPPFKWLNSPSEVMPALTIITVWLRLGFDMIIFLAALQAVPTDYYEAAGIDGASEWKLFRHITLPLLNPQIVFVSIIELISACRVFDQIYVTTKGGPVNASRVIIIHLYETAFKYFKLNEASVMAVLFFVTLLLISVIQWKFFRKTVDY